MKAVVFHAIGDIRVDDVPEPAIEQPTDAIVRLGNANHRRYFDVLLDHVASGRLDSVSILSQTEPMTGAIDAYKAFGERQPGWLKIELEPAG